MAETPSPSTTPLGTYSAPSAQQLLQLLALLRPQQGAAWGALRLRLGSTAHGLRLTLGLNQLTRHRKRFWPTGSTNVKLESSGSFSSLFCSVRTGNSQLYFSNTHFTSFLRRGAVTDVLLLSKAAYLSTQMTPCCAALF